MRLTSGGFRNGAMVCGLSALVLGVSMQVAAAQVVIWGWGPTVSYGYVPPAPIYRPLPPRYVPAPVYGDDFYDYETPRALRPAQIRDMLAARGLRPTGAPTRNGGVYVVDVRDRAGAERRLIVGGYDGRILQTFPAHAVHGAPLPGSRYAGRPADPEIDPDMTPDGPAVIPGLGPSRGMEKAPPRPRASGQKKKKPAKSIAAKPPATPAPAALPTTPPTTAPTPVEGAATPAPSSAPAKPPAAALPPPAQPDRPAAVPAPAPVEAPREAVAPPSVEPPPSPTPGNAAPAATTPPRAAQEGEQEAEQPADRPRRRVRFIKPDAPTVADPNVPGGQLVPIPPPPPVVVSPRSAGKPPSADSAVE